MVCVPTSLIVWTSAAHLRQPIIISGNLQKGCFPGSDSHLTQFQGVQLTLYPGWTSLPGAQLRFTVSKMWTVSLEWCSIDLRLSDVHKPTPTQDLLCSSSSASGAPGHCWLSLTLPEGEPLILMLRTPFAGSPLLMPRMQPLNNASPIVCTFPDQAWVLCRYEEKGLLPTSMVLCFSGAQGKPYEVSHQSVPSASPLHSFFISCKQLSTLSPTKSLP